jgi:hypothetical protein
VPYKLKKVKGGFKVCKQSGGKCFSKKPMPKARAVRQMRHLYAAEK